MERELSAPSVSPLAKMGQASIDTANIPCARHRVGHLQIRGDEDLVLALWEVTGE